MISKALDNKQKDANANYEVNNLTNLDVSDRFVDDWHCKKYIGARQDKNRNKREQD